MQVAKAIKEKNNRKKKKKVFKTAGIYIMKADIYIYIIKERRKRKRKKEKRRPRDIVKVFVSGT
jgi:ADP-glucose pyrophosphorylase